jgi:hypothetical protein
LWMCPMPLDVHLRMATTAKFMLYVFYYSKRKWLGVVAQACNPSSFRVGDRKDCSSRLVKVKSSQDLISVN